ncbi:hypothetical protein [Romboutsia sp.]|uniref:hypothetical protein n=1 Tax=Romboutsia sp. TaxID=1965302 RepID=UPI002D0D7803|nr:hypothetical protein [Romboutsia sp.]HSQ89399.1 hypothetical protein [Romboutsia sp.]
MIIKRIGWEHGLNPRTLWENTETSEWGYVSYRYSNFECRKSDNYYFYKRYVQSLPKYEIQIIK